MSPPRNDLPPPPPAAVRAWWRVTKTMQPSARGALRLMRLYGDQLVCVRYRTSGTGEERLTTIELIVERTMVRKRGNQLRNAFAHNPWRPRWKVWPKYRSVHRVMLDETHLHDFDATALDGEAIKPEDVGGLESWVKVLQYCERIVPQ